MGRPDGEERNVKGRKNLPTILGTSQRKRTSDQEEESAYKFQEEETDECLGSNKLRLTCRTGAKKTMVERQGK